MGNTMKSFSKFVITAVALGCFSISGRAQESQQPMTLQDAVNGYESVTNGHAGVPEDWSTHRLIFSQPVPGTATYDKVMQDPRYWMQQIKRSTGAKTGLDRGNDYEDPRGKKKSGIKKDWTYNVLAGGQVQPNMYPAKFPVYTTTASCSDFVVFPTGVAGTGTTANIIGNYNLYTTGCSGTAPLVSWAYSTTGRLVTGTLSSGNSPGVTLTAGTFTQADVGAPISGTGISGGNTIASVLSSTTATLTTAPTTESTAETLTITGGTVTTSPIISNDLTGSQVAFIQSNGTTASLILLKWLKQPTTPPTGVTGTTTSGSTSVTITAGTVTTSDVGMQISGTGIPTNDTIAAVSGPTVTLAAAATASHTAESLTITAEALTTPGVAPIVTNANYRSCTAPCMTTVSLSADDTFSSPYYDFLPDDTLYVGDDGGKLHQITGVFNGTPTLDPTGFPKTLNAADKTTSPVYDAASGKVFVGNTGALLYAVGSGNAGTTAGTVYGTSSALGGTGAAIMDSPIVDSSAQKVYAFVSNDGSGDNGVYQFATSFTSGTGSEEQVGSGATQIWLYDGAFDNVYYSSTGGTAGDLWVIGNTGVGGSGGGATLYRIPIGAGSAMSTPVAASSALTNFTYHSGTYTGVRGWPSPITEFCNQTNVNTPCSASGGSTTGGTDYLFFSTAQLNATTGSCSGGTGTDGNGCVFAYSINTPTSAPTLVNELNVTIGGTSSPYAGCWATSGIIVDNSVPTGTLQGASQLYLLELNANGAGGPTNGTYTSSVCTTGDSNAPIALQGSQAAP